LFFGVGVTNLHVATLLTVLATAVVIYAGMKSKGPIISVLEHKVTTYIGRISYSLYLWHLPIIYLAYLYLDSVAFYVVAISLTLIFATASYHLVEKPLRYSKLFNKLTVRSIKLVPYLAVVGVIVILIVTPGKIRAMINNSFNAAGDYISNINYIESNFGLAQRVQPNYMINGGDATICTFETEAISLNEFGLREECLKQRNNKHLFYLTGDSHSLHFVPALDNSSIIDNLYFIEIPRQIIVAENPKDFDKERRDQVIYEKSRELKKLSSVYDEVYYVTSLFLSPWQDQLETIENNLTNYIEAFINDAQLIFVAPTPVFTAGPESCVLLKKHCTVKRSSDLERISTIYNLLKSFESKYDNVHVYDPYEKICPDEECLIYNDQNDFLMYIDKDHLSIKKSLEMTEHFDQWLKERFNFSD